MAQNLQASDANTSFQTTNVLRFGLRHIEFKYCAAKYFILFYHHRISVITNIFIRRLDLATQVSNTVCIYNTTLSLVACIATYIYIDCP